jgi:hypothetical protein
MTSKRPRRRQNGSVSGGMRCAFPPYACSATAISPSWMFEIVVYDLTVPKIKVQFAIVASYRFDRFY